MIDIERIREIEKLRIGIDEINSQIAEKTVELEVLKCQKAMAENAVEFRRQLN